MSVARVTEISATNPDSFDAAVREAINRATSTLRNVEGAWVKDMNVLISDNNIVGYKVNLAVTFVLEGSGVAQQAKAEVMIHDDQAVLMADDMPPVPEDRTCQIWVIENDVPKPSGLFKPGEGPIAVVVEYPVDRGDTVAVTLEPEGGSRKPTTDPMLAAKL